MTPPGASLRLKEAEELRRAGRRVEAAEAYREVLVLSPSHLAAALGLAALSEHPATALALLQGAVAAHPGHGGARLELAEALRQLGRLEEAEDAFRRVLAEDPARAAGATLGLARVARARGAPSLDLFRAALGHNNGSLGLRLELAHELQRQGRFEEAEAAQEAVLELSPGHPGALIALGQAARRRGDRAAARQRFTAILAAHPGHAGARLELAHELRDASRLEEAEAGYDAVLQAAPPLAVAARLGLAAVARLRGERDAALAQLQAAYDAGGGSAAALELAAELRDRGELREAAHLVERVLAADPSSLPALLARGLVARAAGDRSAALSAFEAAARAHPAHPQPLIEAAQEHRGLGAPAEAAALLGRALAQHPRHLGALLARAELLFLAEDHEAALEALRAAIEARPDAPQPRLDAARALAALGRVAEAHALLEVAGRELGPSPALALRRAELLQQSGELAAAEAVLAEASALAPRHIGLAQRRGGLLLALGRPEAATALLDQLGILAVTLTDRAALALLRGAIADAHWQPEKALAHQEEALRLMPLHAGAMAEAARSCLLLMRPEEAWKHLEDQVAASASGLLLRGAVARASQQHLGQILDEFRLDPPLARRLRALSDRPAETRIEPLMEILRELPGSTPAAIALMLALRQSGRLDHVVQRAEKRIPRRIGQYWDAREPPEDVRALMATWPAHHPGWTHRVFHDAEAQRFLLEAIARGEVPECVLPAYQRSPHAAQKADLFRLAWLSVEGGWWLDADDRCVGSLDALAPAGADLVLYQEEYATLGNNMIGVAPGHPVIQRSLRLAAEAVNRGDADVVWLSTGPGLLTRAFATLLAEAGPEGAPWLGDAAVIERGRLAACVARHCRVTYKLTDRHWLRALSRGGRRSWAPRAAAPG